jgi:transcriptional regulator with XRE-family HTH domain
MEFGSAQFYVELGRKVREMRKQKHMSQLRMAREICVHRNTLNRWESGESPFPLWVLLRVCSVLECNHLMVLPHREYIEASYRPPKMPVQHERDPRLTAAERRYGG